MTVQYQAQHRDCRWCVGRALSIGLLLGLCLAATGTAAELPSKRERWIKVETENFEIYSNARERTAKQIGIDLERFRAALEQFFGRELRSPIPTAIYVFKNDRSLRRYKYLYNGRPAAVAGYFLPRPTGNYVAIDGSTRRRSSVSARNIVYHEYIHEILRNNEPGLPVWMNEGLAEYFSTFEVSDGKAKIGLPIAHHLVWLRNNAMLPTRQLFAVDHNSVHYNDRERAGIFYAQSWALIHYLQLGNVERRGQYTRLGQLLSDGVPHGKAFTEAFGADIETLAEELKRYVKKQSFSYLPMSFSSEVAAPVVSKLERSEMLFRLGDLAAQVGPELADQAEAHLLAALELDPEHVPAMARLATLRLESGAAVEAERAMSQLARAVELAPKDFRAQYLYGSAMLRATVEMGVPVDPDSLDEQERRDLNIARRALVRAINLRPGLLEAWGQLSFVYQLIDRPGPEALDVQRTAHQLLPDRHDVTINLAHTLARLDRQDEARELLAGQMSGAGTAAARAAARGALFQLDMQSLHTLINGEDLDAAHTLAEQMQDSATEPAHRAAAKAMAKQINRQIAVLHFSTQYNKAVLAANTGDLRRAVGILDALRFLADEPRQIEAVDRLLEQLQAAMR